MGVATEPQIDARFGDKPSLWVALPVDSAVADPDGNVTFFEPGEIKVVAVIGGKPAFAKVNVKPAQPGELGTP